MVRLDEHRLRVAQQRGVLGEEGPVVTHERPPLAPHQLGGSARLTGPSGCGKRDRVTPVRHRCRVDHASSPTDHGGIENRDHGGQQLARPVNAPLLCVPHDLDPIGLKTHAVLRVRELVLNQTRIRHRLQPVIDDDVGRPLGVGGETRQHALELGRCRRLRVDANHDASVDVEVQWLGLGLGLGLHGRPLYEWCRSDGVSAPATSPSSAPRGIRKPRPSDSARIDRMAGRPGKHQ